MPVSVMLKKEKNQKLTKLLHIKELVTTTVGKDLEERVLVSQTIVFIGHYWSP